MSPLPACLPIPTYRHHHFCPSQVPLQEGALRGPEVFQEHPRHSYNCGLRKLRQGPWPRGQNQMTGAQGWSATGRVAAALPTPQVPPGQSGP